MKKNIVILGGGFCGLGVARRLGKKFAGSSAKEKEYQIILIDKETVHVYTSDLYEISTAYNREITSACLTALEDSVCINIGEALGKIKVNFMHDKITEIDTRKKRIHLTRNGQLPYEYLVIALGSNTNYYSIPGLEENAMPLKKLKDAMALHCEIDQFFRIRKEMKSNDPVHFVTGGGGATGVEFTCKLKGYIEKLSEKYEFDPKIVDISIIQAGPEFIGIGEKPSRIAIKRFNDLGIKYRINTFIKKYDGKSITLKDEKTGETILRPADILIWTGGIKVNPLLKDGELEVNSNLECKNNPGVYAGGDNAIIYDGKGSPVPKIGQLAVQEAGIIAHNIRADITGGKRKTFHPLIKGYIIPLGETNYMYSKNGFAITGIIPFLLRRLLDIYYFSRYMPLGTAIFRIFHKTKIFKTQ
ncbi:FAD-dependent oxidoreductase [Patescibacteria group bacterium]|nr:FAD-dependent oxidoreductase [Patescibacteria group bacterium]MBU1703331.1 FAD-dependent oxidoreductase [Patescibacteria group bacterium]MBU1954359.1 FAD-dependent oxidoreductase [Patescibacteria group bacterium]